MIHKIGTVLISLCIAASGINKFRIANKKSLNELMFLRLLQHIRNEISAKNQSVCAALMTFDDEYYKKTDFFQHITENGLCKIGLFFEKNGDMLFRDNEIKAILSDFFSEIPLCRTTTESFRICEKYILRLEKTISENKNMREPEIRLEKTLCFLVAAAVFVVLI